MGNPDLTGGVHRTQKHTRVLSSGGRGWGVGGEAIGEMVHKNGQCALLPQSKISREDLECT